MSDDSIQCASLEGKFIEEEEVVEEEEIIKPITRKKMSVTPRIKPTSSQIYFPSQSLLPDVFHSEPLPHASDEEIKLFFKDQKRDRRFSTPSFESPQAVTFFQFSPPPPSPPPPSSPFQLA